MRLMKVAVAGGLLAFVFTAAAAAQNLRASVPFNFRVADQVLPAGQYTLVVDQMFHRVELRSVDGPQQMYLPIMYEYQSGAGAKAALVFVSYGSAYYLRTVRSGVAGSGFELSPSRAERESARHGDRVTTQVALSRGGR